MEVIALPVALEIEGNYAEADQVDPSIARALDLDGLLVVDVNGNRVESDLTFGSMLKAFVGKAITIHVIEKTILVSRRVVVDPAIAALPTGFSFRGFEPTFVDTLGSADGPMTALQQFVLSTSQTARTRTRLAFVAGVLATGAAILGARYVHQRVVSRGSREIEEGTGV